MLPEIREPELESAADAADFTPEEHERDAARKLAAALKALNQAGQRERHRGLLDDAIDHATRALARVSDPTLTSKARATLVRAHAARAEDALHGAGQLSLSAQRAPTRGACDDGWQRVATLVAGAASAARTAASIVVDLGASAPRPASVESARRAAERAEKAAQAARAIVEQRNHAYTFHTDNGFSFGEGWYLAAAAVLAGVAVQIEPARAGTSQAEAFLRDTGLTGQLQAYRPRPRAMKQTTEIVGRAFRTDAAAAQNRLRAAFLGNAALSQAVIDWVDRRLIAAGGAPPKRKVLLWIRDGAHHPVRNTTRAELLELTGRVERAGLVPVWTGDAIPGGPPSGVIDMILFWKDPVFRQLDMRRAQLQFFEHLKQAHGLVGQLGVTTAGMDGPALMGLPTLYLTDQPNVRMREWVGAVPGYQEIVRGEHHLETIDRVLYRWAAPA